MHSSCSFRFGVLAGMIAALSIAPVALAQDEGRAEKAKLTPNGHPPGKPGKFVDELTAMVEGPQRAFSKDPNSWEFFVETVRDARVVYDGFFAPRKGEIAQNQSGENPSPWRSPPAGWPEAFSWPMDGNELWVYEPPDVVWESFRQLMMALDEAKINEALDELVQRRRFVRPNTNGKLIEMMLPELGQARHVSRISNGRIALAARDGDQPGMLRGFAHGFMMSRALSRQSTLIDHLVAIAINNQLLDRMQQLALDGRLEPDTIRALLLMIDRDLELPDLHHSLRGEHLMLEDTVEWTHTDDGAGDGVLIPGEFRTIANERAPEGGILTKFAEAITIGLIPTKRQTLAEAQRIFVRLDELAGLRYRDRIGDQSKDAWIEQIPENQVVLRALLPAFHKAISSFDQLQAELIATKLILAIELHRQTSGEYPATLDELAPISLDELMIDPEWLAEFRYLRRESPERVLEARAPAGNIDPPQDPIKLRASGYTLYAIGIDGQDDGGTRSPTDRHRHFPLYDKTSKQRGRDVVYVPRGADD
jgi:hypothetical protein